MEQDGVSVHGSAAGRRYPIRIGARSALLLRLAFGVTAERAHVLLDDDVLVARFGWWEMRVPVEDIVSWRIEGPWRWVTAVGVRRSLRDGDVTFAGSPRGGVRLDFRDPVRWTVFNVPALYVGVDDLEGLAIELSAMGVPGEDARQR
jgi:hypothetical protein